MHVLSLRLYGACQCHTRNPASPVPFRGLCTYTCIHMRHSYDYIMWTLLNMHMFMEATVLQRRVGLPALGPVRPIEQVE